VVEKISYKTYEAVLQKYCSAVCISYGKEAWDIEKDRLVYTLIHQVYSLGEKDHKIIFDVPDTWIDHMLMHFRDHPNKIVSGLIRRYILKHWPIKTKELSKIVTARALLPDIPPQIGNHNVRFSIID
jgi:hypothetical protein